jgi:hypothetical protein
VVLGVLTVGGDCRDSTVQQRGNAHPAVAIDGERIKELMPRQSVQNRSTPTRDKAPRLLKLTFEHAARMRFGPVERRSLRRQADAVRTVCREDRLGDLGSVACCVVNRCQIRFSGVVVADAVIGEPKSAVTVHH